MIPDGKNHALLGSKYRYDGESGQFINTSHQRIAEMINDLDHTLTLAWIPPDKRLPSDDKPWALVHSPIGGQEYVVMNLREEDINERLIGYIIHSRSGDKHDNPLSRIEAVERAEALAKAKEWEESMAEAREFSSAVLKSGLHRYRHNGVDYRD